jgi:nucleoside-diphosphate-sugar epimerase
MKFTILGASGFIGSYLNAFLNKQGVNCFLPPKKYNFSKNENLGHVIYCIGLTADFRERPLDAINAHVCKLIEVLENTTFESFLYLSSTRLYGGSKTGHEEEIFTVNPNNFDDLYNLSKLMGESACLALKNNQIKILRLSNIIGHDFNSTNFLTSLIKDAVDNGKIILRSSLLSSKDYLNIEDLTKVIIPIAQKGQHQIYNIASGNNITNQEITDKITAITGCMLEVNIENPIFSFPIISTERLKEEFSFEPSSVLNQIETLTINYKNQLDDTN